MNSLSQDEINALLSGSSPDDSGAADASGGDSVDIMTPEQIAAMLDEASGAAPAEPEPESVDIMTPEQIAAMLDDAAGGAPASDSIPDVSDSIEKAPLETVSDIEGMLTPDEIDVLGEVGNISMGAVATTMYSLLDKRVSITTPRVRVFNAQDVLSIYKIPFVVATIEYKKGIVGSNLLVLRIEDTALITDLLMGGDGTVEEPIELNEMHLSAMSEIMNQMMGASSTALAKLLRTTVDISPPTSSAVDVGFDVRSLLGETEMVTKISFNMEIEGLLKSELIQLMPYELSRTYAKRFMEVGMGVPSGDVEALVKDADPVPAPPSPAPEPPKAAPEPPPPMPQAPETPPYPGDTMPQMQEPPPPVPQQPYPQQADPYSAYPQQPYPAYPQQPYPQQAEPYPAYPQQPYPQYPQAPYPQYPMGADPWAAGSAPPPQGGMNTGRLVDVHPMQFRSFDQQNPVSEHSAIDLVYNIPLQVSVELGKTKKEISEILEFSTGTIVVLDKIAGDPVEIVVNGKLIARGEVVVIDENYGVRITDIIQS